MIMDCIRALSERCPGLLLLTGTPGQIGVAGHFAACACWIPPVFMTRMCSLKKSEATRR